MTQDIAIDLGTANTLIIHNDKVVVDQPSIVAVDRKTEKVIAVGKRAQQMHGKSHEGIKTIRPLKDGVIADFGASEQMIRELVRTIPTCIINSFLHLLGWLFASLLELRK